MWVGLGLLVFEAVQCLLDVVSRGPSLFAVCCFGMTAGLVLGLPQGRPLTRQMGLYVAVLHILLGAALVLVHAANLGPGFALMGLGALLAWSLSGETVRRYFGLLCPDCGSRRARARGFFHGGVRCRDCGREWEAP